MRYVELIKRAYGRNLLIAGHLTAEEIYELKQLGYRMLHQELIDYRVKRKAS